MRYAITAVLFVSVLFGHSNLMAGEGTAKLKNYWEVDGSTMTYRSEYISAHAEAPRGWVSLKVRGDEFLHAGEDYGGIVFRRGEEWTTDFPELNNMSHDNRLGRMGRVIDGVFQIAIKTLSSLPDFEIYAGFNLEKDHDMVMLLSDEVEVLRPQNPDREGGLLWCRRNVRPESLNKAQKAKKGLVIVHESGRALGVKGPVTIEKVDLPDGTSRAALVFPCEGFAANSFDFVAYPFARAERLTVYPKRKIHVENGSEALYWPDSEITYTLNFGWLGEEPFEGYWEVDFQHALGKQGCVARKKVTDEDRDGGRYSVSVHPEPEMPGVHEVWMRLVSDDGEVVDVKRNRVMYDWKSFEPEYNTPDDMKAFWDRTLEKLRETPPDAKVKQVYKDHPKWKLYDVTYNGWDGRRIHACMYIHKDAKLPLPVMIGTHPSTSGFGLNKKKEGIYGSKIKADPRFLTFKPLIRGHEPDAKDIPFNRPWWGDIVERDEYVARSWYCAMVRGMDFLASRPDLADMDRVVARGGSQGGGLAIVTAALDDRVDACLADSPSNTMLHHTVEPSAYGSFGPTAGQTPEGWTLQEFKDMLAYYDPANMAPWIECPTVIGVTTGDLTVHSMGGLGVYKNLTGLDEDEKWFFPSTYISHYHANSSRGGKKMKEIMNEMAGK